ncbi:hypothetical protein [Candidatus Enterococcus mansonii]|uniref:Uncharacterized protein n=1 Tax=Candidatus Enterococcus mansonii TaxID=1834181 RepID=A0ABU8II48_9ENTE
MRKISKIEEQKNHLLYQFLEKLNKEIPCQESKQKIEECCVQQYKLLVNMSFSANILYKGLDYASQLYTHIANIEYARLSKLIIKQNFDKQRTEDILKRLKKAKKELLLYSPIAKESKGMDIFYGFTGGNRKKYKANRNAISQMYVEIKLESEKNVYRYIRDTYARKIQKIKEKREYARWLIKSYTWR